MPYYTFVCESCGFEFSVQMERKNYHTDHACTKCGDSNISRNFLADMPVNEFFEPKTIGGLADKNAKDKK